MRHVPGGEIDDRQAAARRGIAARQFLVQRQSRKGTVLARKRQTDDRVVAGKRQPTCITRTKGAAVFRCQPGNEVRLPQRAEAVPIARRGDAGEQGVDEQRPVNTVPGGQTLTEDGTRVFSVANGNLVSVGDVDAGVANVQVTIGVAHGVLSLSGMAGLTFSVGDGTTDATMTFQGTRGAINAALNNLVYTSTADYNGADTLTITTNDLGNSGTGGARSDTDTVAITVTPVDDAPTSTGFDNVTSLEGQTYVQLDTGSNLVLNDIDSPALNGGTLTVRVSDNNAPTEDTLGLLTGGSSLLAIDGANHTVSYNGVVIATFADASDGDPGEDLLFSFNANATVPAVQAVMRNLIYADINQANPSTATRTIQYILTDADGGTLNLNSTVNVIGVNDAPAGADATIAIQHGAVHVLTVAEFGFSDPDGNAFDSIIIDSTVTAGRLLYADSASTRTPVTAGKVITTADIAAGKLIYKSTPGANDPATDSFTFRVHDNGGTADGGVDTDQSPNTFTFSVPSNQAAPATADHDLSALIDVSSLEPRGASLSSRRTTGASHRSISSSLSMVPNIPSRHQRRF